MMDEANVLRLMRDPVMPGALEWCMVLMASEIDRNTAKSLDETYRLRHLAVTQLFVEIEQKTP